MEYVKKPESFYSSLWVNVSNVANFDSTVSSGSNQRLRYGKYHIERAVTLYLKANLSVTIAQSCVSLGSHLTTEFPSHGLGEPVAYGFQTLAKGAAL